MAGEDHFRALARLVADARPPGRPLLLGITGGVAAGKSTAAERLRRLLEGDGVGVEVLGTDAFLLPNDELARRGLADRKGFPESYDGDALLAVLRGLRAGETVRVPVYSHLVYDRVPGALVEVRPADVVVVDGVNALQAPVVDELDVSLYLDAPERLLWDWFIARFDDLCAEGLEDASSFYAPLAAMAPDDRRAVATSAWDGINAVNLRDHILPSRDRATWVLEKGPGHQILRLLDRRRDGGAGG